MLAPRRCTSGLAATLKVQYVSRTIEKSAQRTIVPFYLAYRSRYMYTDRDRSSNPSTTTPIDICNLAILPARSPFSPGDKKSLTKPSQTVNNEVRFPAAVAGPQGLDLLAQELLPEFGSRRRRRRSLRRKKRKNPVQQKELLLGTGESVECKRAERKGMYMLCF